MGSDTENLVICVACEKRVAELVAEDGRVLCSVCKIEEMGLPAGSTDDGDETDD